MKLVHVLPRKEILLDMQVQIHALQDRTPFYSWTLPKGKATIVKEGGNLITSVPIVLPNYAAEDMLHSAIRTEANSFGEHSSPYENGDLDGDILA